MDKKIESKVMNGKILIKSSQVINEGSKWNH